MSPLYNLLGDDPQKVSCSTSKTFAIHFKSFSLKSFLTIQRILQMWDLEFASEPLFVVEDSRRIFVLAEALLQQKDHSNLKDE